VRFCQDCQAYIDDASGKCPVCGALQPQSPARSHSWSQALNQAPVTDPVALGDLLFVATQVEGTDVQQAVLHALCLTDGQLGWHQTFERALVSGLTATDDGLVLVSLTSTDLLYGEGSVAALDETGRLCWRWTPGVQQVSASAVSRGLICVTVDASTLLLLDVHTGEMRKHFALGRAASLESPCFAGDCLLVPCRAPHLLAVDFDGRSRWRFVVDEASPGAWLDRTPVAAGDRCFTVLSTGMAFALHLESGERLWQAAVGPSGKRLSPPATDGERLYIGARDGLYALDCDTGKHVWTYTTSERISAVPVVAGDVVYVACRDHFLYALDTTTGEVLWCDEGEHGFKHRPVLAVCGDPASPCVLAVDRVGMVRAAVRPMNAEAHELAGDWVSAALVYAQRGELTRGAELLEAHGEPFKAAELWKTAGEWERAALSYAKAGAWEHVVEVWAALGCPLKQAQALEQLARSLEDQAGQAEKCAELWETAARLYEEAGESASADVCRRGVARCLQRPVVKLDIKPAALVEGSWSVLQFVVRNEGYGPMKNLIVHATGDEFEGQVMSTRRIVTLQPGRSKEESLDVCPLAHGRVPLRLRIEYFDCNGVFHTESPTLYIQVADGTETPEESVVSVVQAGPDAAEKEFADLEIRIWGREESGYPVEMTLDDELEFPRSHLAGDIVPWISSGDSTVDGRCLFKWLVAAPGTHRAWYEARGRSRKRRVRLRIDAGAPELHALPWELLYADKRMVSASAETPFSRYLSVSEPWGQPVLRRPVRVLVVISNPNDLQDSYDLAPVDAVQEHHILEESFSGLDPAAIALDFLEAPVTLTRLEKKLREGYHVLHYVGHGAFSPRVQQAVLYMQDEKGKASLVKDAALSAMLARQGVRPRLVSLVACQSAAHATADAFLGLAPQLVLAGVPAVLAMQDVVSIESARRFATTFYRRLMEHGMADLAVNEARSELLTAGRSDAAVPVLLMRLKSGKLWGDLP